MSAGTFAGRTLMEKAKQSSTFELKIAAEELVYVVAAIEREAVLSALDELRAKVLVMLGHWPVAEIGRDKAEVYAHCLDQVLALIDASRSALETPKP